MAAEAAAGLVGRGRELSLLEASVQRLGTGRGGVVWIEGEPGIGKSSLVAALADAANRAGCAVRAGAGTELTETFPLRLMGDCLHVGLTSDDSGIREIAQLLQGDRAASTVVDPVMAAAERMLGVVDRLCARGPLVLVAEDLHWADQPSLGLWSRLARAVDQIPLLLVGTCRPVPLRPELDRLSVAVQELGGAYLDLAPLDQAESVTAAHRLLGTPPGPRLSMELSRAGGNPLYIREFVEALRRNGSITIDRDKAELINAVGALPDSLAATIVHQLRFLSDDLRRALRLAAVLGPEFGAAEWAHVTGQSSVQLADVVLEAINAGVITAGERGLSFRHDLIRQVLLEQLPADVRGEINRQVARTLADAGYGVDVVARQLLATRMLDEWAITWLSQVSEALMHAAPQAYESLLLRAVGMLHGSDDARWEALASRLAQTQFWLGHETAAEQTATAVLRVTSDKELAGRMSVQAVRAAGRQNHYERSLALAEEALSDPTMPARWQARLRSWKAIGELVSGRAEQARATVSEALAQSRACEDQIAIGYAYHALGFIDPALRRTLGSQAIDSIGSEPEAAELRLMLLTDHLLVLMEGGAADEADRLVAEALVIGERIGSARASLTPGMAAYMHYDRGTWDEALRFVAMVPVDVPAARDAHEIGAEIAFRRDQRDLGNAHLRAAGLPDQPDDPRYAEIAAELTVALSLRAQADGNLHAAFALSSQALDNRLPNVMWGSFGPDLIRISLELGEISTANAVVEWATSSSFPELVAARLCQALVIDDPDALLGLADGYRDRGWQPYRAFALEEAAVGLGRAAMTERARAALTEAVQLYADFGATMDIRRADSRLRKHGIRRGPRSIHRRATHGWDALTPSEVRIAELVATGLSNPDIAAKLYVSRATVQTHVSSILGKLRMSSRIELIRDQATSTRN